MSNKKLSPSYKKRKLESMNAFLNKRLDRALSDYHADKRKLLSTETGNDLEDKLTKLRNKYKEKEKSLYSQFVYRCYKLGVDVSSILKDNVNQSDTSNDMVEFIKIYAEAKPVEKPNRYNRFKHIEDEAIIARRFR